MGLHSTTTGECYYFSQPSLEVFRTHCNKKEHQLWYVAVRDMTASERCRSIFNSNEKWIHIPTVNLEKCLGPFVFTSFTRRSKHIVWCPISQKLVCSFIAYTRRNWKGLVNCRKRISEVRMSIICFGLFSFSLN